MRLPFTTEQFFDLLAGFNAAWWPVLVALWLASLAATAQLMSSRRPSDRWMSGLLAAHWLWSGLAYHAAFFTRINPAAWAFAALFVLQGVLLLWLGVLHGRLSFAPWRTGWAAVAWILIAYSLLYPGINALQHGSISRIPAFGVPCPTMIFTAGMLMLARPTWRLSIIPVTWSVIGGSAAFLLGVRADYALPIAGIALAIFSSRSKPWDATRARRAPSRACNTRGTASASTSQSPSRRR